MVREHVEMNARSRVKMGELIQGKGRREGRDMGKNGRTEQLRGM